MIASAGYDLAAHIYSPFRVAGEVSISALANVRARLIRPAITSMTRF
jgi:hypothetical protein